MNTPACIPFAQAPRAEVERLHRFGWLLAAAIGAVSFTPLHAEASVSSTTIMRTPTPPGMLVTERSSFAVESAYVDDKTGHRSGEGRSRSGFTLQRFAPSPRSVSSFWFTANSSNPLSLAGRIDAPPGRPPLATPWSAGSTAEGLLVLERRHQRRHSGTVALLRSGQEAQLQREGLDFLPNLRGSHFGYEVDWSKGRISIIPREILEREVRIELRAYTSKPHLERVAEYESIGELVLELPSGWPKSYRAQGRWKLPVYTLAGKQTIEGIFTDETTWTYTPDASPPLPLPAELTK